MTTEMTRPEPPPGPPAVPPQWPPSSPPPPSPSGYPIGVRFDRDQSIGRLWAVPIVGWFLRWLVLVPHFIVLFVYGFVVWLAMLVTWIPVLFTGRFPGWGYDLIGGFFRWYLRVTAYLFLMAGPYPPFSTGPGYPVEVDFDRTTRLNNLWGIPLLGIMVRAFAAIPHLIVLYVLGILVYFIVLVAWIPVLINGRYPQFGYDIVGGYFRWAIRVSGWIYLMAGPYPPFRLTE
jgi:Domain of unknown function (DUF4389)